MQRNLEPMGKQVEARRSAERTTVAVKMIIYEGLSRGNWKFRSTWLGTPTTTTSLRGMKISSRARSGAYPPQRGTRVNKEEKCIDIDRAARFRLWSLSNGNGNEEVATGAKPT
jgi:hypothetical protein